MSPRKPPVPVNIIAGGLGAGKTTAVNHLLGQRPKGERWAILVNEYGEVGVDAALLGQQDSGSGVEIRELAGGCICCTAGFLFEMSLVTLLGRRPDRLIIEPTGLATLTGIIEVLELPGLRDAVDLRSVITLVDGTRVNAGDATPEEQDQIAAADILLVNHTDRAAPDEVAAFLAAANAAFPPRAHVGSISHARVPFRLLDLVAGGTDRPARPGSTRHAGAPGRRRHHQEPDQHHSPEHHAASTTEPDSADHPSQHGPAHGHHHDPSDGHAHHHPTPDGLRSTDGNPSGGVLFERREHQSAHARTVGWVLHGECILDADRMSTWVREASRSTSAIRLKAVIRSQSGWWAYNIVRGTQEVRPAAWNRTSRIELVCPPDSPANAVTLEEDLRGCIIQGPMQ